MLLRCTLYDYQVFFPEIMTNLFSNCPTHVLLEQTRRILELVPHVDTRTAHLIETPIILVVIVLVARYLPARFALPPRAASRIAWAASDLHRCLSRNLR